MNKQKLGETVGKRVLLKPAAKYFNAGRQFELSYPDVWIVQRKTDEGICLENSNRISFSLPQITSTISPRNCPAEIPTAPFS